MEKNLAIIISVSEYEFEEKLVACKNDASLVNSIVELSNKYEDILYLNDSAKSGDAKDKIASFVRKHQNKNINEVFLYYTGHGTRFKNDFLYLFSDFDDSAVEQTSLRNSELDSMLRSLNSDLIIKVVDACQAGTEYVKSNNELKEILEKSSVNSFKKAYFLFSSTSTETSIALEDYSVFTRSFAESLLNYVGKDIRYRDVMAYISDDPNVKRYQTPLFIQQADNTEVFCNVSDEINDFLQEKFIFFSSEALDNNDVKNEDLDNSDSSVQSDEDKLIQAIVAKSKNFCNSDEAFNSILQIGSSVDEFKWGGLLNHLYENDVQEFETTKNFVSIKSIAKWINENDENYFFELIYENEEYEINQKVEIEETTPGMPSWYSSFSSGTRRIEYQPITKYREVLSGYDLTAPSPFKSLVINFMPKEEALPWVKAFFNFVFSKNKLSIFYKLEVEDELSWDQRVIVESNEWKINHCELKHKASINSKMVEALKDIEDDMVDLIRKSAN